MYKLVQLMAAAQQPRQMQRQQQQHNVGAYHLRNPHNMGGHPAGWGFQGGNFPRLNVGANRAHMPFNVGQQPNSTQVPGMPGAVAPYDYGFPGLGFPQCAPPPPPQIPQQNGCDIGWNQCKQELQVSALAVAAGGTVLITVTPRRVFTPYLGIYTGALATFTIDNVTVDGVEYLGSAVPIAADIFQPAVTDLSLSWGQFSSTTPLIMTVTNTTIAAADFNMTLKGIASRG